MICWTQKFENCFRTNDTVSELIEILDKLGSLDLLEELTVYAINFSYFAIAAWAGSWISTTFQMWTAANQAEVIKVSILLVKKIEIVYFDFRLSIIKLYSGKMLDFMMKTKLLFYLRKSPKM